jgi:hypothetical protein
LTVLVPNGEEAYELPGIGAGMVHVDGSPAKPHYSRMILLDRHDNIVLRANLFGMDVSIEDGARAPARVGADFEHVLDLATVVHESPGGPLRLVRNDHAQHDLRVATRLTLHGGTLGSGGLSQPLWEWLDGSELRAIPLAGVWRASEGHRVTIRVTRRGAGEPHLVVQLSDDHPRAILYNFDEPEPTLQTLYADELPAGGVFPDHDFKWVYRLFDPERTDWPQWIEARGEELPAPILNVHGAAGMRRLRDARNEGQRVLEANSVRALPPHPIVGSCYNARLREPDA